MFRIKICGITNAADANDAIAAGADAIGLNFYVQSPRYCAREVATSITAALPASVCKVGVFVNATADEVLNAVAALRLDLIQLHGDEPPVLLAELHSVPVMKAFRVDGDLKAVGEYLLACHQLRCLPRMVLLDATKPGQYGGTGVTLDWRSLAQQRPALAGAPLVLAGGLTPDNIKDAILATKPWAVDTASGVETSPGKKSAVLMRQFVEAAQHALKGN